MKEIVEKIHSLLFMTLILESPRLSGNMLNETKQEITADSMDIVINAPFYDIKEWEKSGVIKHTGENKNGITDYAYDVNKFGGFGTHNKSEGWVNRAIKSAVNTIANEIGAEVIYEI